MNAQRNKLQELWRREDDARRKAAGPPLISSARTDPGRNEAERLRRRVYRDGWLKIAMLPALLAAVLFAGEQGGAGFWAILGFSVLAVILGIGQIAWSRSWRMVAPAQPLSRGLAATLELWRRRRPLLALLMGATPALAWQIYQMAYHVMNPGRSGQLVNLLFLTAGGPVLWWLSAWRYWARLETWLLQIARALGDFDGETAAAYRRARRRSARRTALIAFVMLGLLLAGTLLFWLANG